MDRSEILPGYAGSLYIPGIPFGIDSPVFNRLRPGMIHGPFANHTPPERLRVLDAYMPDDVLVFTWIPHQKYNPINMYHWSLTDVAYREYGTVFNRIDEVLFPRAEKCLFRPRSDGQYWLVELELMR